MIKILVNAAGLTAMLVGIFSAVTGIRAFTGSFNPEYETYTQLILYNVLMGFISIYAGYLILKQKQWALKISIFITLMHISALTLLAIVFYDIVAQQSINAMIFRSVVWVIISLTIFTGLKKYKLS